MDHQFASSAKRRPRSSGVTASRLAKSLTDAGSVSDGSQTMFYRRERQPSESSMSSRAESLVDSQVLKATTNMLTTGLQTVGLGGKVGTTMTKPTGNEDRAPAGMKKKWQQHYQHGKWIQLGKTFCQIACILFFVACVLWSQFLYPMALNSKTLFEAIIDANDQAALGSTYNKWLLGLYSDEEELTAENALNSIYLWHITNPSEILQQGFKPKLEEKGPFGYIKRTTKYDVLFSDDGSDKVTYKSWTVYDPVEDNKDCTEMFFRMDKANLRQGILDCDENTCDCVDDAQEVTVVNPLFLKLMQQYKPTGIISTLAQEVFADIKDGMTVGFVRATKAYILPTVLDDVFRFRKAFLTADAILRTIFSAISTSNGTATAVSALRGNYADTSIDCQGYQPTGYSSDCPWGLLSFIESAASSLGVNGTFSEVEAEYLLGLRPQTNGSVFDSTGGTLTWITAGRYAGHLSPPSMPHPDDHDLTGQSAFNELVATVCTWEAAGGGTAPTSDECQAKVAGILEWLFGVWCTEENELEGLVIDEWRGASGDGVDIVCDVAGGVCPWRVVDGTNSADWNISASAAVLMIDPAEQDTRNDLSHYIVDGQTLWGHAYTYCTADTSSSLPCYEGSEGSRFQEAANDTLPTLLQSADGTLGWPDYVEQVCEIASNIFGSWIEDSSWLNHVIVNHINASVLDLTGYQLSGDSPEDIGYVQWTTGAVTSTLLGLQTLSTITQSGIWEFMDESRHQLGPELMTQLAIAGYFNMGNLTVQSGRALLDMLAEDSHGADEFRRFVLGQSTTYYGDSDDWWEGPDSTTRSFDSDDILFVEENPYGDFSSVAWGAANLTNLSEAAVNLLTWLDTSFMSSPAQCYVLEGFYESCLAQLVDGNEWPTNCVFFQTIISNTVTGIECDATRIYDNAHSYPKKPGNVIAAFMHSLAWEEVLKKELLLCDDPEECDFSKGGFFTTRKARDVIFDGYTDALTIKLMNKDLASRNLTIRCSTQDVLEWNMYCQPLYNGDCTDVGFQVVHDTYGTVLEVNKTGPTRHLWYNAELPLPYNLGSVDNPVFAVYPGGDWDNETFQKTRDCEKRTLQGSTGLWNSCETTAQTGSDGPDKIGGTSLYYGNSSLLAALESDSSLEVYGTDGTQDTPRMWEGFGEYRLVYLLRKAGLDYLGNDTVVILQGEHLLQFHMARDSDDAALQYPTRYRAEDNTTFETDIRLNRYLSQTQNWLDARERLGDDPMTDFNGMPYLVPVGMVSTQVLTGYATFVSDPHFLTNDLLDEQAAEQMNNIEPDETLHRSLVDIEPVTGKVLRKAIRLQFLFRMERTAFSPDLLSSESSITVCRSPTKDTMSDGAGCYMYVPLLWFGDERVMDPVSATSLEEQFLAYADFSLETAYKGLLASSSFALLGSALWGIFYVLKVKHSRQVWVD